MVKSMDNQRYYSLDALRGIMMLLGIVLHASFFYLIDAGIRKDTPSLFLVLITGFIHQFRMPLFFILAGFFAAMLMSKYGLRLTAINRMKRVLIPFAISLLTILPVTMWSVLSMIISGMQGKMIFISNLTDLQPVLKIMEENNLPARLSPMHLWFLYYLMIFYLFIPVYEYLLDVVRRRDWESGIRHALSSPWIIIPFSLVTAFTLLPFKGAAVMVNDRLFIPTPEILLYYGVFFTLGYGFFSYREILETFQRHTGTYCVAALLMFVWGFVPGYMESRGSESTAVHLLAVLFNALSTWLFIYYLTGLFLRYFDTDTPVIRLLSRSSYWIYLVHFPVVFILGLLLMNLGMSDVVKFFILTFLTSVICYYSYMLLVRFTWISVLLNGSRYDATGRALAISAS
jgi:glucan biosynthesis protein C